ncbi:hypothetical protein ACHAWF_018617 [Thalassiosira exigua]
MGTSAACMWATIYFVVHKINAHYFPIKDVTSSFSRDSSTICLASEFATTKQPGFSSRLTQTTLVSFARRWTNSLLRSSSLILISKSKITKSLQEPTNNRSTCISTSIRPRLTLQV